MVFAAFSIVAVDAVLRATLDSRLSAAARAVAGSLTVNDGHLTSSASAKHRLLGVLGPQQSCAIVLGDGTVALQTALIPRSIRNATKGLTSSVPRYATVGRGSSSLRVVAMPVRSAGSRVATVLVWRPNDFVSDYERSALYVFSATMIVLVIVASCIGAILARRMLAPLRLMASVASEIEAHDLSRRLGNVSPAAELNQLCTTFDRMLDRLQATFDRQQQFTADASHDFRAPLAVIWAEVDLALRTHVEEEHRAAFLSIRAEVEQLDTLIDAMLHAARDESQPVAAENIDVSQLTLIAVERMMKFAEAKSVSITRNVSSKLYIWGSYSALDRAVGAILHNSIKFARSGGNVDVVLTSVDGLVRLRIRNDGQGFSEAALAHGFDRFWRGDFARTRGGSGLGLAIAKTAIDSCGGEVRLENATGGGAQVVVTLPSAVLCEPIADQHSRARLTTSLRNLRGGGGDNHGLG
jgi:signal transduction histidine kinase